ncbi:hypothetical protein, partial [Streptococcus alactolyticus]|uniref:hypothetical protein n=1 Tax=Streptococcus alactolyticus TaxID=29389 RepID=UPI00195C7F8C
LLNGFWQADAYVDSSHSYNEITALTNGPSEGSIGFGVDAAFRAVFTIKVNAGGTLIVRHAQQTTNATASNLLQYASLIATDLS